MAKTNSNTFNVVIGTYGVDAIPANAAVVVRECKVRTSDGYKDAVEFMAVTGVKSTKPSDLVLPLLSVMVADAKRRGGFKSDYRVVVIAKQEVETKLTAKSAFTRWLNGNVLYKSNSEGKLTKGLVMDEGLKLRNTALKVTEKQPIFAATGDLLRILMHKTAEAIVDQATMVSSIIGEARSIFTLATETPEVAKPKPASKKSEKKATTATAAA